MTDIPKISPLNKSQSFHWKKVLLISLFVSLTSLIVSILFRRPLISPLWESQTSQTAKSIANADDKIVVGFIPYWSLQYTDNINFNPITHLAYFSITFDQNGNILKKNPDNTSDLGYHRLQNISGLHSNQVIVITALDNDLIENLVGSQQARNTAIQSTLQLLSENSFKGVNIDFEYSGTPPESTKADFTLFVEQLTTTLRRIYPDIHTSLDMYADAATKDRLWQVEPLSRAVDHIIVMAYDFHRPSSQTAGPIAPLHGGCENASCPYSYDVSQAIADYVKIIPASKIILGIPYYGYQWQVSSTTPYSTTYPNTGSLATINRVNDLLSNAPDDITNLKTDWDETSFSPYLTFTQNQKNYLIWYENIQSLKLKYQLVQDTDLAGIAIWALGYAHKYPEISSLLNNL